MVRDVACLSRGDARHRHLNRADSGWLWLDPEIELVGVRAVLATRMFILPLSPLSSPVPESGTTVTDETVLPRFHGALCCRRSCH